jgi:hypothetical protein
MRFGQQRPRHAAGCAGQTSAKEVRVHVRQVRKSQAAPVLNSAAPAPEHSPHTQGASLPSRLRRCHGPDHRGGQPRPSHPHTAGAASHSSCRCRPLCSNVERPLMSVEFGPPIVGSGSLWRALHSAVTPMHRSQLCADRFSGRTISPIRMARKARQLIRIVLGAMSIRVARCRRLLIPSAVRRPRSSRDCESTRNSREAPQTLALSRAERSRRRHRFDDYCRQRQLAAEIAHFSRPPGRENYVEVRLTALEPEPRNFSITTPERSPSAHSCDLCIGVALWRALHSDPFGDTPQHRLPARKQTLRPVNWTRHGVQANPVIRPSARSLVPGFTLASNGQDKDRIDV